MRIIWLVTKHDIGVTLRQRSFWIIAMLMPLLLVGVQALLFVQGEKIGTQAGAAGTSQPSTPAEPASIGLVDLAGLVRQLPPSVSADPIVRFSDAASARRALQLGLVDQVLVVAQDYLESGRVTLYARNFQSQNGGIDTGGADVLVATLLDYNLSGDAALSAALQNPTPGQLVTATALNPPQAGSAGDLAVAGLVSQIVPYIFYFLLLMGSSFLMRSVVAEKENRTAEVLLVSLDPRQLMVGKILAMSVVLVLQMAIWSGGGMLVLNRGSMLMQASQFTFPTGFFLWAIPFVIFGYLLFASIMAAFGAISNNIREGAQVTWLLIIPLLPTLMFGPLLIEQPKSPLVLFLSLFPLSAPAAMATRLAVTGVPLWQLLLSLALLAVSTYAAVMLAARCFQAGNLLSTEAFRWKRLATAWKKSA